MTIEQALQRLQRSAFRSRFRLSEKDKAYIVDKGWNTLRDHTRAFVCERLAPAVISNDGRQTPMRGHPTFVAQHACACCCRGCLEKWYKVPKGVPLTALQQEKIVNLLMAWMQWQMRQSSNRDR